MSRRRFRWNRKTYRQAHHLARLLARYIMPDQPPAILRRYWELWERQRQRSEADPLEDPLYLRLARFKGDDIPF